MPDRTKIHFSDGQNLVVEQPPRQVADALGDAPSLVKFTKRNGREVYISSGQVTHIEQVPAGAGKPGGPKGKAGPVRPRRP